MKPRLRTEGEGETLCPSMWRVKFCTEGRRDLGPVMRISVLLLLSFRKLLSIQVLISEMQFVMVERVTGVMDLVEM